MPAQYLIRFDDICPTMNWEVWPEIEDILDQCQIRPLLAVVPDNRDQELMIAPARSDFWTIVREWQGRGWAIGLHGYQHLYATHLPGIVGLNNRSEFAGLGRSQQADKLNSAAEIFTRHGVQIDAWIAPAHSFDHNTIAALKTIGIRVISDGFFLRPYVDDSDMMWVPQQLWKFRRLPFGVWTVCFHHNHWDPARLRDFKSAVLRFRNSITDLAQVVRSHEGRRHGRLNTPLSWTWLQLLKCKRGLRVFSN